MNRPTYTEEEKQRIFDSILDLVANGLSVRKAIEQLGQINRDTFFEWIRKDKALADQYARAAEIRADAIFEEMLDIADDGTNDYMDKLDSSGNPVSVLNSENIQRSRLRIDARKWQLSKMNPKKYGDKIDVTTDGEKIKQENLINLKIDGKDVKLM